MHILIACLLYLMIFLVKLVHLHSSGGDPSFIPSTEECNSKWTENLKLQNEQVGIFQPKIKKAKPGAKDTLTMSSGLQLHETQSCTNLDDFYLEMGTPNSFPYNTTTAVQTKSIQNDCLKDQSMPSMVQGIKIKDLRPLKHSSADPAMGLQHRYLLKGGIRRTVVLDYIKKTYVIPEPDGKYLTSMLKR